MPYFCKCATFYASRKAWLKLHARAGIDIINYATKYTSKMKGKLFYCDQIKFNDILLKPRIPE